MAAHRGMHFYVKKRALHACVTEKKVKFDGTLQKLCRKWCCMILWDFKLICCTSTGILHGQFLFLFMEEFLIEGCLLNMHKIHNCTPAVKFRKKLLCMWKVVDNLCEKFYHDTIHGCTEKFQFAWKIWLCVTPKVGMSLIQILGTLYNRSISICVSIRMLISTSDDKKLILKFLDVYECRHHSICDCGYTIWCL